MNKRFISLLGRYSLPTLLSILVLGVGAVSLSNRFVTQDQEKRARLELEQVNSYYELLIEDLDSLNLMISTNTKIILQLQALMEVDRWSWLDWRDIKILSSYIASPANARPYVDSIYIYLDNDRRRLLSSKTSLTTIDAMIDPSWYASYASRDPSIELWTERRTVQVESQEGERRDILSIYRSIYGGSGKRMGVIVMNLLAKRLEADYPERFMVKGQSIAISDRDGRRLLDLSDGGKGSQEGGYARFDLISDKYGWEYRMSVPKRELYRLPRTLALLTAILCFAVSLIGLGLTYRAHRKEQLFIKNTLDLLSSASGERLEIAEEGKDSDVFDYMLTNIIRRFLDHDYMKVQKEAMEYRALQMQINPHFLYNTLETINWRAIKMLGDPNDVSAMLFLMSKILKYAMDIGDTPSVCLATEVEHARYYLELQAIRFPGRFSTAWEIEEGLGSFPVPRLMFQPLIENSFNHGLPEDGSRLELRVIARRESGSVQIDIEDNGRGISDEALALINEDEGDARGRRPIGIVNTKKRLRLLYKGAASLVVRPIAGGIAGCRGTRISISISV